MSLKKPGTTAPYLVEPRTNPSFLRAQVRLVKKHVILVRCLLILFLVTLTAVGLYIWLVPIGVDIRNAIGYVLFATVHSSPAPQGDNSIELAVVDEGAAHSGNYFAWLTVDRWYGRAVATKGWIDASEYHDGQLPIEWLGSTGVRVRFVPGRYSGEPLRYETVLVQ